MEVLRPTCPNDLRQFHHKQVKHLHLHAQIRFDQNSFSCCTSGNPAQISFLLTQQVSMAKIVPCIKSTKLEQISTEHIKNKLTYWNRQLWSVTASIENIKMKMDSLISLAQACTAYGPRVLSHLRKCCKSPTWVITFRFRISSKLQRNRLLRQIYVDQFGPWSFLSCADLA